MNFRQWVRKSVASVVADARQAVADLQKPMTVEEVVDAERKRESDRRIRETIKRTRAWFPGDR